MRDSKRALQHCLNVMIRHYSQIPYNKIILHYKGFESQTRDYSVKREGKSSFIADKNKNIFALLFFQNVKYLRIKLLQNYFHGRNKYSRSRNLITYENHETPLKDREKKMSRNFAISLNDHPPICPKTYINRDIMAG